MKNFLDNFHDDKYQEFVKEEKEIQHTNASPSKQVSVSSINEKKAVITKTRKATANDKKHTEKKSNFLQKISKENSQKYLKIVLALCIVGVSVCVYFYMGMIKIPDFIGKQLVEAQTWALRNNVEIEIKEEFSLEYDANIIMSQDKEANKKVAKSTVLNLVVSRGGDPEELIKLPNFTTMKLNDLQKWKETNKLDNVKIIKEFSETVEKDNFLRMEFKNVDVDTTTYKRKDILFIYVSKGVEVYEKNIEVPNFVGKTKSEVEQWAENNMITVDFREITSETVEVGLIISQSVPAKEKMAKKEQIMIEISTGKAIIVPWFGYYSMEEATIVASDRGLRPFIRERYHPELAYGSVISQSIAAGTALSQNDDLSIEVVYSIGRPYIEDLTSKTENDIAPYFYAMNSKGTNITYTVHHQYDANVPKGMIISATKMNQFVPMECHIDIYVSN